MDTDIVYFPVRDHDIKQIRKLLDFLFEEVRDTGGDGDAIWYAQNYHIDDIYKILEEHYNEFFKVEKCKTPNGEEYLSWGEGQQGIIITNSQKMFDSRPSWQQISIAY